MRSSAVWLLLLASTLPSCFTTIFWRGGVEPEQVSTEVPGARWLQDDRGVAIGLQLPLSEQLAESWPWPDRNGPCWLVVRIARDAESFAQLASRSTNVPFPPLRVAVSGVRRGGLAAEIQCEQQSWSTSELQLCDAPAAGVASPVPSVELVRPVFHRAPLLLRIAGVPFTVVADVLAFPLLLPWTYPLAIEMGVASW